MSPTRISLLIATVLAGVLATPPLSRADDGQARPRSSGGSAQPQPQAVPRPAPPPPTGRSPSPPAEGRGQPVPRHDQAVPRGSVPPPPGGVHHGYGAWHDPYYQFRFYWGYPYFYPYYYNSYPHPWPYEAYGYVAYGSVKLEIPQKDAEVFVDGYYVGIVDNFDSIFHMLDLPIGPHRLEIRAPGYMPLYIDINVQPNRTLKWRGALMPIQG